MTVRHCGERGQTIMVMALSFALFLIGLVALVGDAASLYVWAGRVQAAAQNAAQAGANTVNSRYLYGGGGDLVDRGPSAGLMAFERACVEIGAETAALTTADARGWSGGSRPRGDRVRCVSNGCSVFALVEKAVRLPIPLLGDRVVVRGRYYAAPVVGALRATAGACRPGAWLPAAPPDLP